LPIVEPPASAYQIFFDAVRDLGSYKVWVNARKFIDLTDTECHTLVTITKDLVAESRVFEKVAGPVSWEAFMEMVETGAHSPAIEEKLRGFRNQWTQVILDHVRLLKAELGEARFQMLDGFIQSKSQPPPQRQN